MAINGAKVKIIVAKNLILFSFYLSGNGGITGAGLPPNPEVTPAGEPKSLPNPAGAGGTAPNPGAELPNPPPSGAEPQD